MAARRLGLALLGALLVGAPGTVAGQNLVNSEAPQRVAVTVYRNPDRPADEAMNLRWLNGFALISETRRVSIPAGESDIRFEGVAGGIIPESAIVTGLPEGVIEKNQDAYLLSPTSLLDRSLGKRVRLRRTSRATGEVREQDAIVRSGANGAVVIQTEAGIEALRCAGIPETLVYDQVPEGLSAKPTLSVRTRSSRPVEGLVTLSYLASGFDWQANYVATLTPAGDRMHLFGWVTLGNGDETSFVNAETQAVAGRLNRQEREIVVDGLRARLEAATMRCWPGGSTSDVEAYPDGNVDMIVAEDIGFLPAAPMMVAESLQRVSGVSVNRMKAIQEELGDLKLYRIPEPVTVAARSQKQVALLERPSVKVETFYRARIHAYSSENPVAATRILKTRNRKQEGLGLPLPSGGIVLFAAGRERPVLIGEGSVADRAIDEDVEIEIGEATGLLVQVVRTAGTPESGDYRLTVTNDQTKPVRFDAEFGNENEHFTPVSGAKLAQRNGRPLWSVSVPANGRLTLDYRLRIAG